ncbi:hypothetical protein AMATHDRAFT_50583 [Amanita thiersii Skay4041]|uniref:Tyr recombinase domain-containing protein n=1 Tax=Amanita thiersii Skay4041 TaxID=703135 RepID=A0A2A9NCJ5_9AGAR|nr:hypothetical protein AMATHDRAFT_50583 [Amanita thiersii Skay4041]
MKIKQRTKSVASSATSLVTLKKISNRNREEYGKSKCTRENYSRYLRQGKEFLRACIAEHHMKDESETSDGFNTHLLECAFDRPNRHSAEALEMFLVDKCLKDETSCGKSTAEGIQAAFCDYWDTMEGGRYSGQYQYDEESGIVKGCPARSPLVMGMAITLEELSQIMTWSVQQSPIEDLSLPGTVNDGFGVGGSRTKHVLMRGFMSAGFNLWTGYARHLKLVFSVPESHRECLTRNFELCALQMCHIERNCISPPPHNLKYFKVHLKNRKGWQRAVNTDGNIPITIAGAGLIALASYFQSTLGRPLEADDYVFPYFSSNGIPYPKWSMMHDKIQDLLNEFSAAAGLTRHYSMHCFRWGGAQYRFMHARFGKRWSLSRIRWWGGWAVGEHLQSYETGHTDALCPIQNEAHMSFMGDHQLRQLVMYYTFKLPPAPCLAPYPSPPFQPRKVQQKKPHLDHHYDCRSTLPQSLTLAEVLTPGDVLFSNGEGDPTTGVLGLKDWPCEWYTKDMRSVTGAKRSTRELIAREFARYHHDEQAFLATYPQAPQVRELLKAIRQRNGRQRASRNGTPEEHECKGL